MPTENDSPISIAFDGELNIAVGRSRKEKSWKNKTLQWSELVNKLSETARTAETHAVYLSSPKDRQDEIKDVGGFVGGFINGGRRTSGNILNRQIVTLDIDFPDYNIWALYEILYGNAAVLYSTHKHSPQSPRLRLVIPLDRPVFTDEYEAIARSIAGDLDINCFDESTFEPSRLMYFPSTAIDGEYRFEYCDAGWLSADSVLDRYFDWHDASSWPISDRVHTAVHREIKKQGDPLDKPGLIGAFCRQYSISAAIDAFLGDIYEACAVENRYTYKSGSTAAGLVVYEDKFAYSHHGTDPTSGKLCNAFDLVRIHLFGLKDEDAKDNTPGNKLPSYTAMTDLASRDEDVRRLIGSERLADARADFGIPLDDTEWLKKLDVDRKGHILSTIDNIMLILSNDPLLAGKLALNSFEKREVTLGNLPWREFNPSNPYLEDSDDAGVRHYLETVYKITGVQKIKDGLDLTVHKNAFHPVRDYLENLVWDEQERVETLFIDYLGVKDTPYARAVSRVTLTAAVARIFRPGIKFDCILTLIGPQGVGKSTIIKKLGKRWYSDSFSTVIGKEAFEQVQGVWIVELAELAGLKKAEFEAIKHFLSKGEDRYRVAYGRRTENFPRQCIFIGTTNNRDFLRDPTGNRRFWPLDTMDSAPVKDVFNGLTDAEIDQIWAEAVHLFKSGGPLYLDRELEEQALRQQEEHSEDDGRIGVIQAYLDTLLPEKWDEMDIYERWNFFQNGEEKGMVKRTKVCIAEIWCELFGRPQAEMTVHNTKDLHNIMRKIPDWEEHKSGAGKLRTPFYGIQRTYERKI